MVAFSDWEFMECLVCTRRCASALYMLCCHCNSRGDPRLAESGACLGIKNMGLGQCF